MNDTEQRFLSLIERGHSFRAASAMIGFTPDEWKEVLSENPELNRHYEIYVGRALFAREAILFDNTNKLSTRSMLSELSAAHPDEWGKASAARINRASEASQPILAPSMDNIWEDLLNKGE